MEVTTPKLPPPPRSPQKSSEFSVSLACTRSPRAVTTSAASMLSSVSPNGRVNQPKPPPSVSPNSPVPDRTPLGTMRPALSVARSRSPNVTPGAAVTLELSESTATSFHRPQVEHDAVVHGPVTGDVVAAAAHGEG